MKRRVLRFGAIIGAAAVSTLAVAPVFAAAPVSQATAKALELSIGGTSVTDGLGQVAATNDGTGETKTGPTDPPIGVLGAQDVLDIGALVQQAEAKVAGNGGGTSAACSGIAGNGGTGSLATVGESSCITPGDPVGVNLANLDLTGVVTINPASALGPLADLNPLLEGILGDITAPLSAALSDALGGPTGLGGGLGAVEAQCTAAPGTASGEANLVDSSLSLNVMGTEVNLLTLPVKPAPNTDLLVNLDDVLPAILNGLTASLDTTLADLGSDPVLGPILDPLVDDIKTALLTPIADELGPVLSDNILKVILNKQTKTADTISVTGLDLQLLPAAEQFGVTSLIGAEIANVTCGPNSRVAAPPGDDLTPPDDDGDLPDVPTVVDSGVEGKSDNTARNVLGATAALMLLAGTAGLMGYRRMLNK